MLSLKNMKVGVRLGIAFGLVVALLIIVGVTSITKINNIKTGITSIVEDRYMKVRLGFDVREVADVNNDGYFDVIVQSETDGQTLWRDLSGSGDPWKIGTSPVGTEWDVVGAADVDNDGASEVLYQNAIGETLYKDFGEAPASGWGVVSNSLAGDWVVV